MPSARKSILIMRASSTESLSHWMRTRPSIADCSIGTSSISGREEITIPPTCCEMCRGKPAISSTSSGEQVASRRDPACPGSPRARCISARMSFAESPVGSPSPAGRARPPTNRAPSRPRAPRRGSGTSGKSPQVQRGRCRSGRTRCSISFSRISRGKSRSISGTEAISSFRKRPRNRLFAIGIDVREPDQVADHRTHRRAASSPRRPLVRPALVSRARPASASCRISRWIRKNPESPCFSTSRSSSSSRVSISGVMREYRRDASFQQTLRRYDSCSFACRDRMVRETDSPGPS